MLNIFQHQKGISCLFQLLQLDSLLCDTLLLEYLPFGIRFFEKITQMVKRFSKIIKLRDMLGRSHLLDIKSVSLSSANLFLKMLKLKPIHYSSHSQVKKSLNYPRIIIEGSLQPRQFELQTLKPCMIKHFSTM